MKQARSEAENYLDAIADLKSTQIADWRRERISDANFLFRDELITQSVSQLAANNSNQAALSNISKTLNSMFQNSHYEKMTVIDKDAKILYTLPLSNLTPKHDILTELTTAFQLNQVVIKDIHRHLGEQIEIDIVIPKFNQVTGKPVAAILLEINPDNYLYQTLNKLPLPSNSTEYVLVRGEKDSVVFLNNPLHRRGSNLQLQKFAKTPLLPAARAVAGDTGIIIGNDYRGAQVLACLRKIPDSPWYLVTKIDLNEVYSGKYTEAIYVIILMFMVLLVIAIFTAYWGKRYQLRVLQELLIKEKHEFELTNRINLLLQNANDAILLFDEDNKIVQVNRRAIEMYGFTESEFSGKDYRTLRSEKAPISYNSVITNTLQGDGVIFESVHVRSNGEIFTVEISSRPILYNGKTNIQAIIRDISERKKAEEYLRFSEERFRLLFELLPVGVAQTDENGKFVRVNRKFCEITGYSQEELLQLDFASITYLEDLPNDLVNTELLNSGEIHEFTIEKRYVHKNGSIIWVSLTASTLKLFETDPSSSIGVIIDITDHKRAEETFRLNDQRMKLALEGTNTGLWDWDLVTDSNYYNPAWQQLLGYTQKDVEDDNRLWIKTMHPEDVERLRENLDKHLRGEIPICEVEYQKLKKNGEWIWVLDRGKIVSWDENGKPLRLIGTITDITARKRTEQALIDSEERFELAVRGSSVGIWDIDLVNNSVYFSPRCKELLGYSVDEPITNGINEWISRIHPEDLNRVMKIYSEFAAGKENYDIDQRLMNHSGEYRWYNTRGLNIRGTDGKPVRLVGSVMDIDDRVKFAQKLEESTKQIQKQLSEIDQIYSSSPVGLFALDKEFRYVHINDILANINGITAKEHYGKTVEELLPDVWSGLKGMLQQIVKTGVSFLNIEVSGTIPAAPSVIRYWLSSYYPNLSDNGEIIGVLGSVMDITERKLSEQKIKESELSFRSLFENMVEGFAYCQMIYEDGKPDFKYLSVNGAFEKLTNLHNVEGKKVSSLIPGIQETNAELIELYGRVASTGIPEKIETYVDGLKIWFSISVYNTTRGYFVAVFDNITGRKLAEENLQKLNLDLEDRVTQRTGALESAIKELEAFSYSVSHDLRAPLRAIDGFTKIISDDYASVLDTEGLRLFNIVRSNTQHMGTLIDDLLSLSRVGRTNFELNKVDMQAMANAMYYEITSESQRSKIEFILMGLPDTYGNSVSLRQVWANLLSNAVKYSSSRDHPLIEVNGNVDGKEIIYSISDNGIGYDPQYANKLFGVFQRLHSSSEFEGTGVGLAIVKRIIERHGGRVWAEGKLNEGAKFYFALPRKENT